MMHHTLPTQPRMPPTKPNHQARAQALVRHRHMREKQEFLEARKSSLQHTIETAREELTRVEVAIARNVLTMMQTPKPRIMVESFRNQTFEIPMEEEDVNARLTPSEVKAALRQSHQLRHIAKAMPAAVPITVPKVQLIGPLPRPALDLGATVRPSSAERKEASLTDTIVDMSLITATAPSRLQKTANTYGGRSLYNNPLSNRDPAAFPPRTNRRATTSVSLHRTVLA